MFIKSLVLVVLYVFVSETFALVLNKPVDLTWPFENTTIYWTAFQPFVFTRNVAALKDEKFWLAMNEFCAGEHGGTYLNAPYNFDNKKKAKVGKIPLENFITRGALLDMTELVHGTDIEITLQVKHLTYWERRNGPFPHRTLLLVKFGWSQYYLDKSKYLGLDRLNGILTFPGISAEAAEWIVKKKKIIGVGVDTTNTDPGSSRTSSARQILISKGLYLLENVKLLEDLPVRDFNLFAIPLNIAEGTGAPVRLIAFPRHYFV